MKEPTISGNEEYSFNYTSDLNVEGDCSLVDIDWRTHYITIQLDTLNCEAFVECKGKRYKLIVEADKPKLLEMVDW